MRRREGEGSEEWRENCRREKPEEKKGTGDDGEVEKKRGGKKRRVEREE